MTETIYTATSQYIVEMEQRPVKHHVSVSGVLKHLGVLRSGYNAGKKRIPSATEKHRGEIKERIRRIYEDSHQNYDAPEITQELLKCGEKHPDTVWASDITHIWTFDGFVYLTSIMELYSRKIIAWVLSETLEASYVAACVEKAKKNRKITQPLIIHTGRGCQ